MEEYVSDEESEARAEREQERLENEPSYMRASLEEFSANPTDIDAKYLWLRFTLSGEGVPDGVMEKMIDIIKYDVQFYEDQGHSAPGTLSKLDSQRQLYELLHLAKENPARFWEGLYPSSGDTRMLLFDGDTDLLERIRVRFPNKKKLKPKELYEFFGELVGIKEQDHGFSVGERMASRYRTFKKNLKNKSDLF